jgi:hypothetical protein
MRLVFSNSFHNTSVNINAPRLRVTETQAKRVQKVLCGMKDCSCCKYDNVVDSAGKKVYVADENMDGSYVFEYGLEV